MMLRLWIDLEWTDVDEPDALSFGLAADDASECYVEILDEQLERRCSDFVREHVLGQFGRVPGARASDYSDVARRVGSFLASLRGELELFYDDRRDRELLQHALERAPNWSTLASRVRWCAAHTDLSETPSYAASLELSQREGLERHHGLADARAFRAAHLDARRTGER
jgi:hypothetical protein